MLFCFVFFFFFASLHSLWNLSFPTRDQTQAQQWKHRVITTGPPGNSLSILKCVIQWHWERSQCCANTISNKLHNIFITAKENAIKRSLSIWCSPTPSSYQLAFLSMVSFILSIEYKWNHTMRNLLCLAAQCFWGASKCSMCQYFSFWLNDIPLYEYTIFSLSVHPVMDVWIVSTFWLLWIVLLWTFMYKNLFSVLLVLYLGVGSLDDIVILCFTFWGIAKLFSIAADHFMFPTAVY